MCVMQTIQKVLSKLIFTTFNWYDWIYNFKQILNWVLNCHFNKEMCEHERGNCVHVSTLIFQYFNLLVPTAFLECVYRYMCMHVFHNKCYCFLFVIWYFIGQKSQENFAWDSQIPWYPCKSFNIIMTSCCWKYLCFLHLQPRYKFI